MFSRMITNTVKNGTPVTNMTAREQFCRNISSIGTYAAKLRGIKSYQISMPEVKSPGSPLLAGVPGTLARSLPESRQKVADLAGDKTVLANISEYFFSLEWTNRKESQTSILLANAPTKESQHVYGLLTRPYVFTDEDWKRLEKLTDSQLMYLLASCVPNGMQAYPSIPRGKPVSPIPIAEMWSKEGIDNVILGLGYASYIKAKLNQRVESGDSILIPLLAETQDPYHVFSGALMWSILLHRRLKIGRGLFMGAGQSPWRILDIANNEMGAIYWDMNFEGWVGALKDKSLPMGKDKPFPVYSVLEESLRKQYKQTSSLWIRRGLGVLDVMSELIVQNPETDSRWGDPMYNYTPSQGELKQAQEVQEQLQQEANPVISEDQAEEIGKDLADKINKE